MIGAIQNLGPPPGAPVDHVVNTTFQTIFTVLLFAVALAVVVVAARRPVKLRDWSELRLRMLTLLGGALSTFVFEPAADRLGQVWY